MFFFVKGQSSSLFSPVGYSLALWQDIVGRACYTIHFSLYYFKKFKQYRTNNHIKIAKSVKTSKQYINNDKFHKRKCIWCIKISLGGLTAVDWKALLAAVFFMRDIYSEIQYTPLYIFSINYSIWLHKTVHICTVCTYIFFFYFCSYITECSSWWYVIRMIIEFWKTFYTFSIRSRIFYGNILGNRGVYLVVIHKLFWLIRYDVFIIKHTFFFNLRKKSSHCST